MHSLLSSGARCADYIGKSEGVMTSEAGNIISGIENLDRLSDLCVLCRRRVIADNDSGWEGFVSGGTEPICSDCEKKYFSGTKKASE